MTNDGKTTLIGAKNFGNKRDVPFSYRNGKYYTIQILNNEKTVQSYGVIKNLTPDFSVLKDFYWEREIQFPQQQPDTIRTQLKDIKGIKIENDKMTDEFKIISVSEGVFGKHSDRATYFRGYNHYNKYRKSVEGIRLVRTEEHEDTHKITYYERLQGMYSVLKTMNLKLGHICRNIFITV